MTDGFTLEQLHQIKKLHFNGLTPAEDERLAVLVEEIGEALQVIGKITRHGYESSNPTIEGSPTNRQALEKELGDIRHAVLMMTASRDVHEAHIAEHALVKSESIIPWLHHQGER